MTLPFTTRKIYYGKEGMMKAEMNFIRLTLASESMEPSIHYSDMPVENIFGNPEFCNRWIEGLMLLQKKGLKLVVIHNMSRSLHELLLGMENGFRFIWRDRWSLIVFIRAGEIIFVTGSEFQVQLRCAKVRSGASMKTANTM